MVYNSPILLPILSTSVIRATQGGITAITAPLLNPYIAANAMINLAGLSGSIVPSKANVLRITSATDVKEEAEREEECVEVSLLMPAGSQRTRQKRPERNEAGVRVLKGPMTSARRGGSRRPRTEAPFIIAREVENEVLVAVVP